MYMCIIYADMYSYMYIHELICTGLEKKMEPILGNLNTKTLPCLTEWPFELSSQHDVGAVKTSCSTLPRSRPCAPKWHSGRRADMALRSAARDLVFNKLMEYDKI